MTSSGTVQCFWLRADGHTWRAETSGRLSTRVELFRDDEQVLQGSTTSTDGRIVTSRSQLRIVLRRTRTGRVRRVTLHTGDRDLDMDPEPGSPAARRLAKERAHPWRYAVLDVLVAIAGVLVPLLGIGAVIKAFVAPLVEWLWSLLPDVQFPRIPWPRIHLPRIPWPHIDLSWIPHWTLPGWLIWTLDHLDDAKPVILAALLAGYEVRRRAKQDAVKKELADQERQALLTRFARDLDEVARRGTPGC